MCKEGESAPIQSAIFPLAAICVILLMLGTYAMVINFRTLKFFVNHYWRACTGDLHYTIADGIKYLVISMEDFASCTDFQMEMKASPIDLSFKNLSLRLKDEYDHFMNTVRKIKN